MKFTLPNIVITIFYCLSFVTSPAQNDAYVVKTSTGCAHVRKQASSTAQSLACLEAGTHVSVITAVPFWREIKYGDNKKGWIAKKYIVPEAEVPIDTSVDAIPPNAFLSIHFVDVGQGDAIWIQTHDDGIDGNGKFEGYSIIIDGGPYSADNSNPLRPYVENIAHHNADIEALILTHPHIDHFNGVITMARHFNINHYYDPGYPVTLPTYKSLVKLMKGTTNKPPKAKQVHIGVGNFGTMQFGKELKVEVLHAWKGDENDELGSGNTEENNASIVLRIQYGKHTFLFMGDAEGKDRDDDPSEARYVEKILLETVPAKLKATVLKVAHHGSETSSTIPFIQAVDPDYVIVQSGRKKFKGTFLPDKSTLQRYCDHNPQVKIYQTNEGDKGSTAAAVDKDHIVIRTNGDQIEVKPLKNGQLFNGNYCQ